MAVLCETLKRGRVSALLGSHQHAEECQRLLVFTIPHHVKLSSISCAHAHAHNGVETFLSALLNDAPYKH